MPQKVTHEFDNRSPCCSILQPVLKAPRLRHSLDQIAWQPIPASEPATLEYLIRDYYGHMQDHLQHILTGVTGL